MKTYQMWIDGQFVDAESGQTFAAINPATEEEIGRVPLGGKADIDKAVAAAKKAFPAWSKLPQFERSRIMTEAGDILLKFAPELAKMEMLDHGFPYKAALRWGMMPGLNFKSFAEQARYIIGEVAPRRSSAVVYMQYEPIGVCGLITPWNFPLFVAACKLAPCLAVGNTCVLKPPSVDSLPLLALAEALSKTGIPPGVINIVTGPGATAGEALAAHPDVKEISFTGSSETGKRIMALASVNVKRMSMELGGKNPFIVLEDADLEAAAESGVHASLYNAGQICAAPGKYYVHEKVYDQLVKKIVERVSKVKIGLPEDPQTELGPLASQEQRAKVEGYIRSAVVEGARIELGGGRPSDPALKKGYYLMPTVLTNVTQNMKVSREEIFGPVFCFLKFSSDAEVIELANDNVYGLGGSVWSRDTARAMNIANRLETGCVWVNGHLSSEQGVPWGGVKESGFGKEGTHFSLTEYLQLKVVCVDLAHKFPDPANQLP
jgi:acyl-CoA reductase-like NAD-dependent aldehyde dehydrogenase